MLVLERKDIHTTNTLVYELLNTVVYEKIGSKNGHISRRLRKNVDNGIRLITDVADPRGTWMYTSVQPEEEGVWLADGAFPVKSRKVSNVLKHATRAILCAVTLGPGVDAVLNDKSLTTSSRFILDTIASLAVEICMENLHTRLLYESSPGCTVTHRYSPGYCDWHINGQEYIFRLLSPERIGMSLSGSYLMTPRKSITAVLGTGPVEVIEDHGNACSSCGNSRCPFRRKSALFQPVY